MERTEGTCLTGRKDELIAIPLPIHFGGIIGLLPTGPAMKGS
jgi:hypothetical protein